MRLESPKPVEKIEMDMTPMIDMTFQLITFFMMLINFSQVEQDSRVDVPVSSLVEPAEEGKEDHLLVLQFTNTGTVLLKGQEEKVGVGLKELIEAERRILARDNNLSKAIVVVRADTSTKTGDVLKAVEICRNQGFEKFRLRAKEEIRWRVSGNS